MSEKVEIRTELLLSGQEQIKSELRAIKDRFGEADKGREKAQQGLGNWAATASHLANVVGTNVGQIVDRVRGLGASFLDAGASAESGDQAVAALIATAQGASIRDATASAEALGDALDVIAVNAGVAGERLGEAFQTVLERSGASAKGVAAAMAETEKLATVSAKLGKDVGAVSGEYSLMGEGVLRTRGQLFQLLQSTGIFGDKTKGAAEAWGKLTEEERAKRLSYGLDRLSGQMAKMPPTFNQAKASLENMLRIGREEIGQPLVEELTPAFEEVVRDLRTMRPEIREFGQLLAKEGAGAIRDGGRMLRDALSWLRDHKAEIADDIRAAAQAIRDAFGWVVAHKEEISLALGVGVAAKYGPGAVRAGSAAVGAVSGVARAGSTLASAGELGGVTSAAGGAAVAVGVLTAGIIALGYAAKKGEEVLDAERAKMARDEQSRKELQVMALKGDVEGVQNAVYIARNVKLSLGELTPALRDFYDTALSLSERVADARRDESDALRRQIEMGQRGAAAAYAAQQGGDTAGAAQLAAGQVAGLVNAYNQAVQQGNQAMAIMAAQTIGSSGLLRDAFLKSTTDIEGGFDAMASMLLASGGSFGAFATQLRGKGATPAPPKNVFTGGQTFNIKQDFRDKDPDKIAIVFRRDLGRVIERRAAARYAGPFGA